MVGVRLPTKWFWFRIQLQALKQDYVYHVLYPYHIGGSQSRSKAYFENQSNSKSHGD